MYKILDCPYDRQELLKLFSESNKAHVNLLYKVTDDIINHPAVVKLFKLYPEIHHNIHNFELGAFQIQSRPYVSPGNNGIIVFPLGGACVFNFYSYGSGDREKMSPLREQVRGETTAIRNTLTESVTVENDVVALNGLMTHDYNPVGDGLICAILKIPLNVTWDSL